MTRSSQHTFLPACALVALLLGACGGGGDTAPTPPAPAAQTITFASPGNQTFGVAPAALVATASSGLAVPLASTTASVCAVSGTTLTLVGVGTCTVVASQPGNASFLAATSVSNSFSVVPTPQTITFISPGNQTLGTAPPALVATSSSGLPVTLTSTTASVCTLLGSAVTLLTAGDCTVIASQAGNGSFAAAANVSQTFTVAAAPVATINAFNNGGFEVAANNQTPAGGPNLEEFAEGWQGGNSAPPTRSSAEARTGSFSARFSIPDPGFGGSNLFRNSIEHGGMAPVALANWGTSPTLTFWIKGNSSETGSLTYALRYVNASGGIISSGAGARTIWTGNLVRDWTQITLAGIVIPVNAAAVFFEMTLAVGPTGVQPPGNCGVDNTTSQPNPCDYGQAAVYLDDVNLQLLP